MKKHCSLFVVLAALVMAAGSGGGATYGNIEDVAFISNPDGDTFVAEVAPAGSLPEVFRQIPVRLRGKR